MKRAKHAEIRYIYCPICGKETLHTVVPIGDNKERRKCMTSGCLYSKDT